MSSANEDPCKKCAYHRQETSPRQIGNALGHTRRPNLPLATPQSQGACARYLAMSEPLDLIFPAGPDCPTAFPGLPIGQRRRFWGSKAELGEDAAQTAAFRLVSANEAALSSRG